MSRLVLVSSSRVLSSVGLVFSWPSLCPFQKIDPKRTLTEATGTTSSTARLVVGDGEVASRSRSGLSQVGLIKLCQD